MLHFISLFLIISCTVLSAATPAPFAKIANPVYRNITPVEKLAKSKLFKEHQYFFSTFVKEAKMAKAEGFSLEKLTDPTQRKQRGKAYITLLRQLSRENREIAQMIKATLRESIRKKRTKAFRRILASRHSILTEDSTLVREITRYQKALLQKKKVTKKKKKRLLRSAENLNGLWQSHANGLVRWSFREKALIITSKTKHKIQRLEGTWKIEANRFIHSIHTITNHHKNKKAHTRKTKVLRYHTLLLISESTLKVKDIYGDVFELKKQ